MNSKAFAGLDRGWVALSCFHDSGSLWQIAAVSGTVFDDFGQTSDE